MTGYIGNSIAVGVRSHGQEMFLMVICKTYFTGLGPYETERVCVKGYYIKMQLHFKEAFRVLTHMIRIYHEFSCTFTLTSMEE